MLNFNGKRTSVVTENSPPPFGPWHPGVASEIPDALRHLSTFLRPENVFTSYSTAAELRDLTGLELSDVVAFRPQRLALHELLVRVTADLSVPDGSRIEDLGINFRQITRALHASAVAPKMDSIIATYDAARRRVGSRGSRLRRATASTTTQVTPARARCESPPNGRPGRTPKRTRRTH